MKRLLLLLIISTSFLTNAQVPTYVPTDGLVAWYPMNPNTNEWDSSHPPVVDNTVATTDRFGNAGAIDFNGGGLVMGGLLTQVSSTFTYSIWVKNSINISLPSSANFQNLGNDNHGAIHPIHGAVFGPHASNAGTGLYVGANGLYLQEHSHGYQRFAGWANHDFTEWSLVTVVYSNNAPTIYINDAAVATFPAGARTVYPSLGQDTNGFANYSAMGIGQAYNGGTFAGQVDEYGIWNRALTAIEVQTIYLSAPPQFGCNDASACNYDTDANVDDGSCIPSGCMEEEACNYDADAQCEGEACDYSCCPGPGCCGDGMHWDADAQTCVITPPSVAPDADCTLLNLQELAEGYQILLAENAELDSLFADCNGTASEAASNGCADENSVMFDGHDYDLVEIGDQCWFAENLQTERYANGDLLEGNLSNAEWSSTTSGAQAVRNNDDSNLPSRGRLYNWFAVADTRGLCPSGWHIPTDSEWKNLELELGMPLSDVEASGERGSNEGQALKASPSDSPSWNGNNSSGFNAYPGGARDNNGGYYAGTSDSFMWTSTPFDENSAWIRDLDSDTSIERYNWSTRYGFSVRCVKD